MASPVPASPLVSTQWLADHLGSDNLVILDATVFPVTSPRGGHHYVSGHADYLDHGHVPGAVFADLIEVFSDPDGDFGFARPSAELFERAATSVGVDNDTTVVVYDGAAGQWAARVWWLFRAFGYDNVAVLDGGLTKWNAEERPSETGYVEPGATVAFTATPRPELWVDKAFVESIVAGETDAALVCALSPVEFLGESSTRPRGGHIPGSTSLPAAALLDGATNTFLDGAALADRVMPATGSARQVVTYCGGGIAAAASAMALILAGHENVAVYDGSLNEWSADAAAPLVTCSPY